MNLGGSQGVFFFLIIELGNFIKYLVRFCIPTEGDQVNW